MTSRRRTLDFDVRYEQQIDKIPQSFILRCHNNRAALSTDCDEIWMRHLHSTSVREMQPERLKRYCVHDLTKLINGHKKQLIVASLSAQSKFQPLQYPRLLTLQFSPRRSLVRRKQSRRRDPSVVRAAQSCPR